MRKPHWSLPSGAISIIALLASVVLSMWLTIDDLKVQTLVAVAIGLMTTLLGFQVEISLRISERARRLDQHGRLLECAEQQPHLLPVMTELMSSAVEVLGASEVPVFRQAVTARLEQARLAMADLQRGRLRVPANDSTLMLEQWATTKRQVRATTLPREDMDWWLSAVGQQYLDENAAAVARGIEIERVFLLDDEDEDTLELLTRSHAAGIKVLTVSRSALPPELRINVVIFDGELVVDEITNADGEVIEFIYSTSVADLSRIESLYARLRSVARPFVPAAGRLPRQVHLEHDRPNEVEPQAS